MKISIGGVLPETGIKKPGRKVGHAKLFYRLMGKLHGRCARSRFPYQRFTSRQLAKELAGGAYHPVSIKRTMLQLAKHPEYSQLRIFTAFNPSSRRWEWLVGSLKHRPDIKFFTPHVSDSDGRSRHVRKNLRAYDLPLKIRTESNNSTVSSYIRNKDLLRKKESTQAKPKNFPPAEDSVLRTMKKTSNLARLAYHLANVACSSVPLPSDFAFPRILGALKRGHDRREILYHLKFSLAKVLVISKAKNEQPKWGIAFAWMFKFLRDGKSNEQRISELRGIMDFNKKPEWEHLANEAIKEAKSHTPSIRMLHSFLVRLPAEGNSYIDKQKLTQDQRRTISEARHYKRPVDEEIIKLMRLVENASAS